MSPEFGNVIIKLRSEDKSNGEIAKTVRFSHATSQTII